MQAWNAGAGTSAVEYTRAFVLRLDSAVNGLVDKFRTASGQPVARASHPTKQVSREKQRWQYSPNVRPDQQTFSDNIPLLQENLPGAILQNAWSELSERFDSLQAVLENCETIAYMIDSPERYAPWQQNYETWARAFYAAWYPRLKAVHDGDRNVARLLNAALPPERRIMPLPPPLPPTAPTPGGGR